MSFISGCSEPGGVTIRQQIPLEGTIFLAYSERRPAVYPFVAKITLLAVIVPRGVVADHFPGEWVEGEMEVTAV